MAIGGALVGAVIGLIISRTITKEEKDIKRCGFGNMKTYESKISRKWEFETIWNNPMTGNQNEIKTFHSIVHRSIITTLNNTPIFTHESEEGNKIFIQKVHMQSINEIKKKIKNSELNLT